MEKNIAYLITLYIIGTVVKDFSISLGSANSLSQPRDVSQFSGGAGGYASTAGGTTTGRKISEMEISVQTTELV